MQLEGLPSWKMTAWCGKRTWRTSFASRAPRAARKWLMKRCERTSMATGRSKARRGAMGKPLELYRQADLDDLHWRQAVVVAHGAGVAAEQRIEALLPQIGRAHV